MIARSQEGLMFYPKEFEIIVIGGGHAGCEAALAAAQSTPMLAAGGAAACFGCSEPLFKLPPVLGVRMLRKPRPLLLQ